MKKLLSALLRLLTDSRMITLVYVPAVIVFVLPLIFRGLLTEQITTTVTATAGTVDWQQAGKKSYSVNLPDGLWLKTGFEKGQFAIVPVPVRAVSLAAAPGVRVHIAAAGACTYDFSFSSAEKDASLSFQTVDAGTGGAAPVKLDIGADTGLVFRYQRSAESCQAGEMPVELALISASTVNVGDLVPQRQPNGDIYSQAISRGVVEIFNEAWSYNGLSNGRYKMSEYPLGLDDTLFLDISKAKAQKEQNQREYWNGSVFLGSDGIETKISALHTGVEVRKVYGNYRIYFNIWQAIYTQPVVQFLIGVLTFCGLIFGFVKK